LRSESHEQSGLHLTGWYELDLSGWNRGSYIDLTMNYKINSYVASMEYWYNANQKKVQHKMFKTKSLVGGVSVVQLQPRVLNGFHDI
jgi:hypothetical protein